jgi:hypothetical protein
VFNNSGHQEHIQKIEKLKPFFGGRTELGDEGNRECGRQKKKEG